MSLYIDVKFVDNISHLLRNFKKVSDNLYRFSCPVCGDSKKKKSKARGYLYRYKESLRFKCHNCGEEFSFGELIKSLDSNIYKEYVYESFLEDKDEKPKPKPKPQIDKVKEAFRKKKENQPTKPDTLNGCFTIASLGPDHPARIYLESRKIPMQFFEELYWTDDFPSVVEKVCPGKAANLRKEGRIIIPFLNQDFELIALQGRSLDQDGVRYITIKAYEDAPRIFGMHRLAKVWKRIYAVEGPMDSFFLPNCVALAGSDIPKGFPADKTVIVYDNEPRKKETCDKIEKAIERNYRVCIWPDSIKEKDINLMILSGYTEDKIRGIIDDNSYTGMEAKFRLQQWRMD